MNDYERNIRAEVWRIILRGLPPALEPIADEKLHRPFDVMNPERFKIRELMRNIELLCNKR
jgi:hypothetical protein